ncbi:MAG: glycosyltransferase family 4 protein [Planctomycetota bacterium]|nr:glycosyltransferase family 4 protein [Planctomycetota bacterium]
MMDSKDRLRILYHHRTLADGAEGIHIREMVAAFRELGHEVLVVSPVGESQETKPVSGQAKQPGFLHRVKHWVPRIGYELAELGYNVLAIRRLRKAIDEFKPDLIYDRYNTFCDAALRAAKQSGTPIFLEVNSPMAYERSNHDRGLVFSDMASTREGTLCRESNHVFAVSTPLRDYLVAEYQVESNKISVLPNGANPDTFTCKSRIETDSRNLREQLGIADGHRVVGFTGILREWHDVEMLCRAFSKLNTNSVHLLLVGDGPSESNIKALVKRLNMQDRVTITGRVSHHQVANYVGLMDVAVSPKATFYASPMKILEYMAMGVAVIAPDMPNIRDLLEDEVSGLLFTPANEAELRICLEKCLDDDLLCIRLGENARKLVETRRNWICNAEEILRKLNQIEVGRDTATH